MSNFKLIPNRFSDADVVQKVHIQVDGIDQVAEISKSFDHAAKSVENFSDAQSRTSSFKDVFKDIGAQLGNEVKRFNDLSSQVKVTSAEMKKMNDLKASIFMKNKSGFFDNEENMNESSSLAMYKMMSSAKKLNDDLDNRALENAKKLYDEEMKRYNAMREARRARVEEMKAADKEKDKQDPLASIKQAMSGSKSYLNALGAGKQTSFGINPESLDAAKSKLQAQVDVMQRITAIRNETAQAAADELKQTNAINRSLERKNALLKESIAKQVASGADINPLTGASNNRNDADVSVDKDLISFSEQLKEKLESEVTWWDKLKDAIRNHSAARNDANSVINQNGNVLDKNTKKVDRNASAFERFKHFAVSYRIVSGFVRGMATKFMNLYNASADYTESLNLYSVALGKYAKEGYDWAMRLSDALYLDPNQLLQYTGSFYNLVKGLGVGADDAFKMSKNLTQISYDLSSLMNIGVDAAYQKVTSAITGQSRAVAYEGVAMQQASLQEKAAELGIKKKVSTMTQAEKTYLRYIQLMDSTVHMELDLNKTITSSANVMRVAEAQWARMQRAIGNLLTAVIKPLIPYFIALVQIIETAALSLAKFFGIKIENGVSDNISDIGSALEDTGNKAAGTAGKINRTLAAFDDLNVVESKSSGSGGSGSDGSVLKALKDAMRDYDMLENYSYEMNQQIEAAKQKLLEFGKIAGWVAGVVIGYKIFKTVGNAAQWLASTGSAFKTLRGLFGKSKTGAGAGAVKQSLDEAKGVGESATQTGKSFNLPSWKTLGKGLAQLAAVVTAVIFYVEVLGLFCRIPGFKKNISEGSWALKEVFFTVAQIAIPVAAAAYGAVQLSKIPVKNFAKGFANLAILVGGITGLVEVLGALSLIPGDLINNGSYAVKTVFGALGDVALPLIASGVAITALAQMNVGDFAKGFANFAIVVGGTTTLFEAIGLLNKIPGDLVTTGVEAVKTVFNGIADIAVPLVVVAGAMALAGLGGGDGVKKIAQGFADFAIVIGGTTVLMEAIGLLLSIPGGKDFLSTGIDSMKRTFNGIAEVALPLVAVSAAFALAGLMGGSGVTAFALGLADFAIVVGGTMGVLTAIGAVLSLGPLKTFLASGIESMKSMFKGLYDIAIPLGEFTALILILGLATPAVVLSGLAGFALVIGGLSTVLVALGALNQIPGFSWIVGEGGEVLCKLGDILGGFVGSIVAGFAGKIFDGLPKMGEQLSDFMNNAKDFFDNIGKIDEGVASGIENLASAMLKITASDVLDGLTSWFTGGASLADFGEDLKEFGPKFADYAEKIKDVDPDVVQGSSSAALSLAEMASKLPNKGGVVSWFTGDNTLDVFASYLPDFGKAMASYGEKVANLKPEVVKASAEAALALAEMASKLPNKGGMVSWFTGDNTLDVFASYLPEFGTAMADYYKEIKDMKPEVVKASADAASSLSKMASNLPNKGGMVSWFTGDNTLDVFASYLPEFGKSMAEYSNYVKDLKPEVVTASAEAAKSISELARNLPNSGGLAALFSGDNKLSDFGKEMESFGKSMKAYAGQVAGVSADKLNAVSASVTKLVDNLKRIKDGNLNDTLGGFGKNLSKGGEGIEDFFKSAFSTKTAESLGEKFGNSLGAKMKSALKSKIGSTLELSTGKSDTAAKYTIKMYAGGGYPTSGELFFANENGNAEFISKIGNKTAVANQDQMVQALTNAILAGFSSINGGNGTTNVYIGNKKVYEGQASYQNRQNDRYGTSYIKV